MPAPPAFEEFALPLVIAQTAEPRTSTAGRPRQETAVALDPCARRKQTLPALIAAFCRRRSAMRFRGFLPL